MLAKIAQVMALGLYTDNDTSAKPKMVSVLVEGSAKLKQQRKNTRKRGYIFRLEAMK